MSHLIHSSDRRASSGFSLIEILVGLLIGMLSVIVIMQVFGAFEGNKRSTTGGDDAQINGTIALYGLERDAREAGYGINAFSLLGCSLSFKAADGKAVKLSALAPVTINPATTLVPAGDSGTDTLLVIFGNSDSPSEGDLIAMTPSTGSYPITTPTSFTIGDYVIAQPASRPSPCDLALDKVTAKSDTAIAVTPGNPSGLALGSMVYSMGQQPVVRAYAVRGGNLTVCDYTAYNCGDATYAATPDPKVWVSIASNIVGLRAQYGRDTSGVSGNKLSGIVDTYDQITPGSAADKSGLDVQCAWARTLALRIALVARSGQYTKYNAAAGETPSTSTAPTWAGSASAPIDLSSDSTWKNYRYKTLQTTVPIRNLVWQGSQSTAQGGTGGC
ncbi:PilW family protein [Variovorax sp. EL159]|uniref:PilW family protein n=1 Tax=Variovorax sp. EL159 TaxID=1566270 RepID=UPI0008818CC5|nr:PilW family protein [Variovorax sp. EL159]SCX71235.1 type IV pilus assembly protein PilW [Variovorax sp. EL159]